MRRTQMLPVYDPFENVWYIEKEDGSLKTISNEEYEKTIRKTFRTRYDGGELGSTGVKVKWSLPW